MSQPSTSLLCLYLLFQPPNICRYIKQSAVRRVVAFCNATCHHEQHSSGMRGFDGQDLAKNIAGQLLAAPALPCTLFLLCSSGLAIAAVADERRGLMWQCAPITEILLNAIILPVYWLTGWLILLVISRASSHYEAQMCEWRSGTCVVSEVR